MPRFSNLDWAQIIGQIQTGVPRRLIAKRFNVHKSTISRLVRRHQRNGEVKDSPYQEVKSYHSPRRQPYCNKDRAKSRCYSDWIVTKFARGARSWSPSSRSCCLPRWQRCRLNGLASISPDLNPIEHVWTFIKDRVNRRLTPTHNLNDFERMVQQE